MSNARMRPLAWLAASTILLHAPAALPQSLGDAAARERARRERQKPAPAKVLTNDDLPTASTSKTDAAAPAASSSEAKPSAGDATGDLERERRKRKDLELQWRERFANAREAVARADERAWREVVRTDFYSGIPVQMKVKEHVETEELKQARQALADLEEAFRRTGLPPGWARQ